MGVLIESLNRLSLPPQSRSDPENGEEDEDEEEGEVTSLDKSTRRNTTLTLLKR